jgi:hypothetical protein
MPIIKIKTSTTASNVPANGSLGQGELAYNIPDNKLYVGDSSGNPVLVVASLGAQSASGISITGGAVNGTTIGSSTKSGVTTSSLALTGGGPTVSTLSTDTTLSGSSGTTLSSQAAIKAYHDAKKGGLKNIYSFTSSGTYNKSGSDVQVIRVICIGAGGGGRGYGESGGAGGYSELLINATGISSVSVTVAGNTSGGGYYGSGNGGGTTSFGGYLSAGGGNGANDNQSHSGGHGGLGYGGNVTIRGGGGTGHRNCHTSSHHNGGNGGASFFGGGIANDHYGHGNDTPDGNIAAWGAGGSGNADGPRHSGSGGKGGICIVYEYK